jgi:hypothetical protein
MSFSEKQDRYRSTMATQALRIAAVIESMPDHQLIVNSEKLAKADAVARKALSLEQPQPAMIVNVGLLANGSGESRSFPSTPVRTALETTTNDHAASAEGPDQSPTA